MIFISLTQLWSHPIFKPISMCNMLWLISCIFFYFSFERYIRICYYCQLRETSVLSEDNVKFYKLFVVLFPILFYVPKCFEVRSHYVVKEVKMQIDCQKVSFIYKLSTNLWYLSINFFHFVLEFIQSMQNISVSSTFFIV